MTSAGIIQGTRAARTPTRSRLCRALLVVALALAPALIPYLLKPAFLVAHDVGTTHIRMHAGAHMGHPTEAPVEDPHVHPHCLRCVLFAASLPARVVLTPSAALVEKPLHLEVGLLPNLWFNPNVAARAPPEGDNL